MLPRRGLILTIEALAAGDSGCRQPGAQRAGVPEARPGSRAARAPNLPVAAQAPLQPHSSRGRPAHLPAKVSYCSLSTLYPTGV